MWEFIIIAILLTTTGLFSILFYLCNEDLKNQLVCKQLVCKVDQEKKEEKQ